MEKSTEPGGTRVLLREWQGRWTTEAVSNDRGPGKSRQLAAPKVRSRSAQAGGPGGEGRFAHLSKHPGSYWGHMSLYLGGLGQFIQDSLFLHSSLLDWVPWFDSFLPQRHSDTKGTDEQLPLQPWTQKK